MRERHRVEKAHGIASVVSGSRRQRVKISTGTSTFSTQLHTAIASDQLLQASIAEGLA